MSEERTKIYTEKEQAELAALWDELAAWPEVRRHQRFGQTKMSTLTVHKYASERGLKLAATGKPWAYETALRALQRAGKAPARVPRPKRRGRGAVAPEKASEAPAASKDSKPEAPPPKVSKTAKWLATAAPPAPAPAPEAPSPDAIYAFFERDLGDFLRPEDLARARGTRDAVVSKKIQELTADLAAKTATRARLNVYVGVYDRLIARIIHRLDVLREKGVDPESEARAEMAARAAEDEESVAIHEEASAVVPILPMRRRVTR